MSTAERQNKTSKQRPPTIKGMVEIVHFASPTFTAGKLRRTDSASGGVDNGNGTTKTGKNTSMSLTSFTAPQELKINSQVTLHGQWEEHKLYGAQFKADTVEYDLSLDATGLCLWLQKNREIRGIGPSKAKIIADTFGESFDGVIRNEPERVAQAAKLSSDTVANLQAVWIANQDEIVLITYLAAFGLSIHEIDTLRAKYGHNTVGMLRTDPYLIIGEIPRFAFKKVDKIALRTGIEKTNVSRIDHGILWCLTDNEQSGGHTYIKYTDLLKRANGLLELDSLDSHILIAERCKELQKTDRIQIIKTAGAPGCDDSDESINYAVLRTATWNREKWLYELIDGLRKGKKEKVKEQTDTDIDGDGDIANLSSNIRALAPLLNDNQLSAVVNAVVYPISMISGGAGTGKTFTVNAIKEYHLKQRHSVILCAPTGKAARRLEEVTNYEASTIHRLLGYDGRGFTASPENPISADVLIIDEFSMVDSSLAYFLFQAIDWQKTSVVLVGDHNQLPPVGPGNMLRDLIVHNAIPTTILNTVVRQAGVLKTNCCAILDGRIDGTSTPDRTPDGQESSSQQSSFIPWQIIDSLGDADNCRLWIEEIFTNMLRGYAQLDVIHGLQILAPMKDRECGVNRLNVELQRIYQQVRHNVTVEPVLEGRKPQFCQHDKVIQMKNDYTLGVMNGTIGQVVGKGPDASLLVKFEGQDATVEVSRERKNNLSLAYALTIHKCQGSEFPFVILVIHKSQSYMHSRNLIYTGATRAKKKLIIVGDAWGIRNSVTKVSADQRKTWFGELLRQDRTHDEQLSEMRQGKEGRERKE